MVIRGGDILGLYRYGLTIFGEENLKSSSRKLTEKYNLFKQVTYTLNNPKNFSQLDLYSDIFTLKVGNVSTKQSEVFTSTE